MHEQIPFHVPFVCGYELKYIQEVVANGRFSGNGPFTQKCQTLLEQKFGFGKCLLTASCTDALEMAAILLDIKEGDEVIMPSFTFVSTANAFVLRGAKIVFADSGSDNPNIDADNIEQLITDRTKAVVIVHYGGVACDMDKIHTLARKYNIELVEDAAHALGALHNGKFLGSFGGLSTFSFHDTKGIHCGEGGALIINNPKYTERAEIIWDKGTNRKSFINGLVNKYEWVDVGSSFQLSEITAAFLFAQLQHFDAHVSARKQMWRYYSERFGSIKNFEFRLPTFPDFANHNALLFYIICKNENERNDLQIWLREIGINTAFHYASLHRSKFFAAKHDGRVLHHSDNYTACLLRFPLHSEMNQSKIDYMIDRINEFKD